VSALDQHRFGDRDETRVPNDGKIPGDPRWSAVTRALDGKKFARFEQNLYAEVFRSRGHKTLKRQRRWGWSVLHRASGRVLKGAKAGFSLAQAIQVANAELATFDAVYRLTGDGLGYGLDRFLSR
jgi:hypothetical protein